MEPAPRSSKYTVEKKTVSHTMAAADDGGALAPHGRLADITVRGVSALVRTTANVAKHDAVPFLSALAVIVQKIMEHAAAVGENNQHVVEAGRRAEAVRAVLSTLQAAEFPTEHPAYVRILESLAEIEEYAHKWGDKGYWAKRFGVSMSACTSKAIKYKHLFELQFQVRIGIRVRVRVRVRIRGWVGDI